MLKMIEARPLAASCTTFGSARSRMRTSHLPVLLIIRASSSDASNTSSFRRSDFTSQPFTGSYDAGEKTSGPLGDASVIGAPRLTPRVLKTHLDNFVVGQERAKKILSVAVYNHYQRIREVQRSEEEEQEHLQQQLRRAMSEGHPLEGTKVDHCDPCSN